MEYVDCLQNQRDNTLSRHTSRGPAETPCATTDRMAANSMQSVISLVANRSDAVEFYSDVSCDALLRTFLRGADDDSHHMLCSLPKFIEGHCSFAQNVIGLGHAGIAETWNVLAKTLVALSLGVDDRKADWFSKSKKKVDRAISRDLDSLSAKLPGFLHDLGVWGPASTFLFAWEFANCKDFRNLMIDLWMSPVPVRDSMRFEHSVLARFQWNSLNNLTDSACTLRASGSVRWTDKLTLDNFKKYGKCDALLTDPAAADDILGQVSDLAALLQLLVENFGFLRQAYLEFQQRGDDTLPFVLTMFHCPEEGKPLDPEMFDRLSTQDQGFRCMHRFQHALQPMFFLCQKDRQMDTIEHVISNLHNTLAIALSSHTCFLGMSKEPEVERTMRGYLPNYQIFIDYSVAFVHGYRAISTSDLKQQCRLLSEFTGVQSEIPFVEMQKTTPSYSAGVYCFGEIMSCAHCRRLLQPDDCIHWCGRYFCMKRTEVVGDAGNCMLKFFHDKSTGVGEQFHGQSLGIGHGMMCRINEEDESLVTEFVLSAMRGGDAFGLNPTARRFATFVIREYNTLSHDPIEFMQYQSQHLCEYLQRFCVDHEGVSEKIAYIYRCQIQWQAQLHTFDDMPRCIKAMREDNIFNNLGRQLCQTSFHTLCMLQLQNRHGIDIINNLLTSKYARKDVNFHGNAAIHSSIHLHDRGQAFFKMRENNIALYFPEGYTRGLSHGWLGSLFMASRIPLSVHYKSDAKLKVLVCKVARYFILMRLNSCLKWKDISVKLASLAKAKNHYRQCLLMNTLTYWPNKKMTWRSTSGTRDAIAAWKIQVAERRASEQAAVVRTRKLAAFKLLRKLLNAIKERKRSIALRYGTLWLKNTRRCRKVRCTNKLRVFGSFHVWKSRLSVLKRDKIISAYVTFLQEMRRENVTNKAFDGWRSIACQWIQKRKQHASVVKFINNREKKIMMLFFRAVRDKRTCRDALLSRFTQRKQCMIKRVFLAQLSFLVQERHIDADAFVSRAAKRSLSKLNSNARCFVPPPKPPPLPLTMTAAASAPPKPVHVPVPVPYPVLVNGSQPPAAVIADFIRTAHSQLIASGARSLYRPEPGVASINFGIGNYPVNTDATGVYGESFMM